VSAASHTGNVRPSNQDAYGYSADAQCFAVCDGMGGAAGGEVASRIAIETFLERLGPELPPDGARIPVGRRIEQAVAAANRILYTRACREHDLHGMGTTMVALVLADPELADPELTGPESANPQLDGSAAAMSAPRQAASRPRRRARNVYRPLADDRVHAWIAHVGDSRCYLMRGGSLRRCTRDHSLVEEQVRLGQMTPAQAAASAMRHVITRAVGARKSVAVEVQELAIEHGDLFLLCSDGLTRELQESRIAELLEDLLGRLHKGLASEAELSQALVQEALNAGGGDNITCLVVYMA